MNDLDNKIRDFSSYLLDLGFLNSLNYNELIYFHTSDKINLNKNCPILIIYFI